MLDRRPTHPRSWPRRLPALLAPALLAAAVVPTSPVPASAADAAGLSQRAAVQAASGGLLQVGSRGPAVARVQRALQIPDDGDFGPQTDAAVRAFQRSAGIGVDGIVGPVTAAALAGTLNGQTLQRSSRGPAVARVQRAVQIPADGDFGPQTDAAVRAFQRSAGVGVDGIVGPQTTTALFQGSAPPPGGGGGPGCAASDSCTPQSFAQAILQYPGIQAPATAANLHAMVVWERVEGGGAGCPGQPAHAAPWAYSPGPAGNPLNTNRQEPGSVGTWNSDGVRTYGDAAGHTCWFWGIKANGDALLLSFYGQVRATLRNPSSSSLTQCVALARAVGASPWGTGDFEGSC
jgi:peptidoglycan hydrolase-like protein with peptidoglycan-binding domain